MFAALAGIVHSTVTGVTVAKSEVVRVNHQTQADLAGSLH